MRDESFPEVETTKMGLDCQQNPKIPCSLCAGNYHITYINYNEFIKILNNNTNDKNINNYDLFGWLINYIMVSKFNSGSGEWTKDEEPLQKEIWNEFKHIFVEYFKNIGVNECNISCVILTIKNMYLEEIS